MTRWVRVTAADEVPDGRGRAFSVGTLRIALFRDGDTWHAIDESCPHQGTSLATGVLHEGRVICPLHAWVFDVTTVLSCGLKTVSNGSSAIWRSKTCALYTFLSTTRCQGARR